MSNESGIQARCAAFTRHKVAKDMGVYPYFKPLVTSEGSRCVIDGDPKIMLGVMWLSSRRAELRKRFTS